MERGVLGRRSMLMTRDAVLIESVQRLAAVAGVDLQVDAEGRGAWSSAPLVLIGADIAPDLVSMHLPRRSGVIVIGVGAPMQSPGAGQVAPTHDRLWRDAVALGAEHVILLPDAESWLIARLGEAADGPSRSGRLIAVTSASGGSGASTLAVGLAMAAIEASLRTALIDGDHCGGGLDLVMGAEAAQGIRWPDLAQARGRLSSGTLDYALPHPSGVALLSHARPAGDAIDADAAAAVIEAMMRGYDRVIVDLHDHASPLGSVTIDRATDVIVLVPATIRGIAAAHPFAEALCEHAAPVQLVLRTFAKGIAPRDAEHALGLRNAIVLPDSPAVAARANQGDAALPSDAYGKAVRALLASIQPAHAGAA